MLAHASSSIVLINKKRPLLSVGRPRATNEPPAKRPCRDPATTKKPRRTPRFDFSWCMLAARAMGGPGDMTPPFLASQTLREVLTRYWWLGRFDGPISTCKRMCGVSWEEAISRVVLTLGGKYGTDEERRALWPWRPILADCNTRFPHPRDAHVKFFGENGEHRYEIDGMTLEGQCSASAIVKDVFPPFVEKEAIAAVLRSKRHTEDPSYHFYQMTADQIKADFDASGPHGHKVHWAVEAYMLQRPAKDARESGKLRKYFPKGALRWLESEPTLQPYRMEWVLYSLEWRLTGTIDAIYIDTAAIAALSPKERADIDAGRAPLPVVMIDWKTCRNLTTSSRFGCGTHPLTADMDDCKTSHYTIQLNVYRHLLERYYGVRVTRMALVQFRKATPDDFKTYPIPFVDLSELLNERERRFRHCKRTAA